VLDHLTCGFGAVSQLTYGELVALRPQRQFGRALSSGAPTFAALLELARQRAMVLHLDVKEPGLEDDIARQFDDADAWDHVVSINTYNTARLRTHPKLKLLAYKGPGLSEARRDMDPDAVQAQLAQPGQMIMVDDPRVAVRALKRDPYQPTPLPHTDRARFPSPPPPADTGAFSPPARLAELARRVNPAAVNQLLALVEADFPNANQVEGDDAFERRRTAHIVERAWAAQQLGERGVKSARVVAALERLVRKRSLHKDWSYHGLDGAVASRALGKLGARESVPVLVAVFRRVDPELKRVANPALAQYPMVWADFRAKMYILPALGELRGVEAKKFLLESWRWTKPERANSARRSSKKPLKPCSATASTGARLPPCCAAPTPPCAAPPSSNALTTRPRHGGSRCRPRRRGRWSCRRGNEMRSACPVIFGIGIGAFAACPIRSGIVTGCPYA